MTFQRIIKKFDGNSPFRPQPQKGIPIKEKKQLPKKKATGEAPLFKALAAIRPHVSFVSGEKLNEILAWNCAHVLPKGKYPHFRLVQKNIVFLTKDEHDLWDQARHKIPEDHPGWKRLFEMEEKLKEEYKQKHPNK